VTILKNLVVKNGSYTTRDGQEKHRWLTIGQLHEGQHGQYVTLDAHINLAGLPRKDGDTRVMVNLYDPRDEPRAAVQAKGRDEPPPLDDHDVPW